VRQPILTNDDLEKIRAIGDIGDNQFSAKTLDITYPPTRARRAWKRGLDTLCERAEKAVRRLQHHHPVRPHGRTAAALRSRPCWRPQRSITT
jgi:hypothetical protein